MARALAMRPISLVLDLNCGICKDRAPTGQKDTPDFKVRGIASFCNSARTPVRVLTLVHGEYQHVQVTL
jgi:hypothetical protein